MPALSRESDIFPHDLLARPELGLESAQTWWALYTRPQQDKKLMRCLTAAELPFYAPVIGRHRRARDGRIRTAYVPLFPSYVFIYGANEERYQALTTSCVSQWMRVADPHALTEDLRRIHRLIQIGVPLTPEARLTPGLRVRIRSGPFLGFEGVIVRRCQHTRLVVAVNFLQRGASVQLDDCQVENL